MLVTFLLACDFHVRYVSFCLYFCVLGEGGVHFSACFIDTKNNNKYMSVLIFTTFRSKGVQLFLFFFAFFLLCFIINFCVGVCV